jgi:hypothetical protein
MSELNGTFDNRANFRREHWLFGKFLEWHSVEVIQQLVTCIDKSMRAEPWGHYPDLPGTASGASGDT